MTVNTHAPTEHEAPAWPAEIERVHGLVRDYAQLVRERFGARVRDVWIYGSAARGDWTADSDIDVLILLDYEEQGDVEWLVETAYRLGLAEHHLLLQPVMFTTAEFDHLVARERLCRLPGNERSG